MLDLGRKTLKDLKGYMRALRNAMDEMEHVPYDLETTRKSFKKNDWYDPYVETRFWEAEDYAKEAYEQMRLAINEISNILDQ